MHCHTQSAIVLPIEQSPFYFRVANVACHANKQNRLFSEIFRGTTKLVSAMGMVVSCADVHI